MSEASQPPEAISPQILFGYKMVELYFNKSSLMEFSDSEKQVLREAMRIIGEKTDNHQGGINYVHDLF